MSEEKKQQEETQEQSAAVCEGVCDTAASERDEWKNKCLRVAADFENFKKRTAKDREQWQQLIVGKIVTDMLSLVDNLERAISSQDEPAEALQLMYTQFGTLLNSYNVHQIETVEMFDPSLHEAVTHVPSKEHESGAIIEVLQKGYLIGDTVLRPTKVAVAK